MGAAVEAVEHRFGAPEIEGMPVLTLQRDPDIFQRGQMRKHRRNLERAHQAQPRHVGRRHRGDVLSLVQDLAGRRLQELGQQIEARRLAGPVRTDQRVNAATADPKIDIANGEETREFLGQSAGFENELIGQSNFPHQPSPRSSRAWPIFPNRQALLRTPWKSVPDRPPPGGICRQRPALRKVESWASGGAGRLVEFALSPIAWSAQLSGCRDGVRQPFEPVRKAAINAVWMQSSGFIEYLPLRPMIGCFDHSVLERIAALEFESANPSVVKSIKQRDLLNTWLRLYAREQRCRASRNTSPSGSPTNLPDLVYYTVDTAAAAAAPDDPERRHADVDRLWPHRQGPVSRRISRGQARAGRDAGLLRMHRARPAGLHHRQHRRHLWANRRL